MLFLKAVSEIFYNSKRNQKSLKKQVSAFCRIFDFWDVQIISDCLLKTIIVDNLQKFITIIANNAGSILCLQSENEALQRGDMIKKIDDYDARDVRHVDAQNLLQNSETIKLVVERSEPSSAARTSSRTTTDTIITASPSPPTIFRPIIGNGAAATSLSECNTISITTARFWFAMLSQQWHRVTATISQHAAD